MYVEMYSYDSLTGPLLGVLGTHLSHMQILEHSSSNESQSLSDSAIVSVEFEFSGTDMMLFKLLLMLSFMIGSHTKEKNDASILHNDYEVSYDE